MGMLRRVTGGPGRRARRWRMTGCWRGVGAVVAGLAVLGGSAPAAALTLAWSVVPSPGGGFLRSVSCVSAAACTAVGGTGGGTLAESWDGTRWRVQPTPSPSPVSELDGVSCVSVSVCTAVGWYQAATGFYKTLIESWNGTRWRVQPSPSPSSAGDNWMGSVSCASAAACTAVGLDDTPTAGTRSLIESWNGTRWLVVAHPQRGGITLSSVSCASAAACMAVGGNDAES